MGRRWTKHRVALCCEPPDSDLHEPTSFTSGDGVALHLILLATWHPTGLSTGFPSYPSRQAHFHYTSWSLNTRFRFHILRSRIKGEVPSLGRPGRKKWPPPFVLLPLLQPLPSLLPARSSLSCGIGRYPSLSRLELARVKTWTCWTRWSKYFSPDRTCHWRLTDQCLYICLYVSSIEISPLVRYYPEIFTEVKNWWRWANCW